MVLKVLSPEVIHKSDLGGVKLNLKSAAEVELAYKEIISAFSNNKLAGVAVQKMVPPGLEAIVGVSTDPAFGPVLMFGLGGIFVEVLKDISFRVLPVTEPDIDEMLKEIRGYNLLQGFRGTAVDLPALKDLLLKVSALVVKHPEIKELELNPVFLYPKGNMAVDARIFLRQPDTENLGVYRKEAKGCLENLFYPSSLYVLGASDKPGKLGWNVFHNLLSHRFPGKLYPVNINAKTIQGVAAYSRIDEIEEPVDAAIILVPVAHTLQAFEECCKRELK